MVILISIGHIMPKFLMKRRRRWYAVLEVPKQLQTTFGKKRFKQSLQTESLSIAERRVMPVIAEWKAWIEAARLGDSSLNSRVAEWRVLAEVSRQQGMTNEEIHDLSLDLSILSRHEDPNLYDVHKVTFGEWIVLSDHIDAWVGTLENEQKTIDMMRSAVTRFAKNFRYAHDATNRAVIEWVEMDLIEQSKLSYATCRRIMSACRGYWTFLQRRHKLDCPAPFNKVVPKANSKVSKKAHSETRKGFAAIDYSKLLDGAQSGSEDLSGLIRLGAYTGARIEELCSLPLTNVGSDRLHIEDAKTEAGLRIIPIHPHISDLVANLRTNSTDGFLLSGLTFNKYNDRSNAIGKRFGRLKTKLGYGSAYVFHSLRKGVASQLEAAGIPENVAARLLGHEFKTMTYGLYAGGKLPFAVLNDALCKVDWT